MRSTHFSNRPLRSRLLLILAAAGALVATDLAAQTTTTPPRRRQPAGGANGPRYDPSTVVTLDGTFISLDTVAAMSGVPGRGVHALLKTRDASFPVHLGPVEYLSAQSVRLAKGDAVRVTGSRIVLQTVPTILAATVVKGADTLKLRDAAGMPQWRGLRRAAR